MAGEDLHELSGLLFAREGFCYFPSRLYCGVSLCFPLGEVVADELAYVVFVSCGGSGLCLEDGFFEVAFVAAYE
jgi:hypothetical protein